MKRKMKVFCGLALVGLMCSVGLNTVNAQQNENKDVSIYSVQPGTEEWAKLGTVQNKMEACQISESILTNMTDTELIQAVWEYPFLCEVFLYNDYATGVQSVYKNCDALKALLSRSTGKDALVCFIKERTEESEEAAVGIEEVKIEAIMAIMAYCEEICVALNEEEVELINQNSKNIRIKEDEVNGSRMAYLYTPNGSLVLTRTRTCNHSSTYHSEFDDYLVETFGVTLISSGTCRYNCHSYAWYSTSNSNSIWIDDPMIYMTDGSYSLIMSGMNSNSLSAQNGDKVFYGTAAAIEDSHSAILVSSPSVYALGSRMARSKWGEAGVFEHAVSNVPSDYLDSQNNVSVWR